MRWPGSLSFSGSIPDRSASVWRLAPLDTASRIDARTAWAATVGSNTIAPDLPATHDHVFDA
jgi:hypothetical protein